MSFNTFEAKKMLVPNAKIFISIITKNGSSPSGANINQCTRIYVFFLTSLSFITVWKYANCNIIMYSLHKFVLICIGFIPIVIFCHAEDRQKIWHNHTYYVVQCENWIKFEFGQTPLLILINTKHFPFIIIIIIV